jgi:hypothetical protein
MKKSLQQNHEKMIKPKARVIAYYLPQYHPIPENDEWWGKGFTEWTNVGRAKPLFKGHYQPRVPADLGYYDLRLPEIREAQAEMARSAGIEGFMYWHYWFGGGKTIIERPFKEVLKSGTPDFPFCLGWGNHSWTNHEWSPETQLKRRFYLIEQTYPGKEDIENHFMYILDAFQDKRYITIDGKPAFNIYDPLGIPNVNEMIYIWNNLAIKNGLKGIHFIGIGRSNDRRITELGFDAINSNGQWAAESAIKGSFLRLLYGKINWYVGGGIKLNRYEYKEIIKYFYSEGDKLDNIYPTVISQWDRSPRSGRRGVIYTNSNPELFKKHISQAVKLIENKQDEHKILFLKSWNEWAEGNYVEPDLVYGHGYLDSLREVILG